MYHDIEVAADQYELEQTYRAEYAAWLAQPAQLASSARLQARLDAMEQEKAQRLEQHGALYSPEEVAEMEGWLS